MTRHTRCPLALIALIAALAACQPQPGPREPEFPTFDARQPFPELLEQEQRAPTKTTKADSSYEQAIRRELTEGGEDGSTVSAQTQGVQTFSVSSIFVADIPSNFSEWQWSTDGPVTVLTHRRPGSYPDALIYFEAYSPAVETFPSFDVARFQYTVDPGLTPTSVYPPLLALATRWISSMAGVPPLDTIASLQKATTRTMGRGLGYTSTQGTFTGWKWVGHNDYKVALRLGRTSGTWAAQPASDFSSRAVIDALSSQVPGLKELAQQLGAADPSIASQPSRQAAMILGSASRNNSIGVHIAILCEHQPVCPVAEELSTLLSTLRPASDAQAVAVAPGGPLKSFAAQAGFTLLNADEAVSAPQMVMMLEAAMRQQLAQKRAVRTPTQLPGLPNVPGLPNLPLPQGGSTIPSIPAIPLPLPTPTNP